MNTEQRKEAQTVIDFLKGEKKYLIDGLNKIGKVPYRIAYEAGLSRNAHRGFMISPSDQRIHVKTIVRLLEYLLQEGNT